jgi:methylthioribose-1-phosphate isomerase
MRFVIDLPGQREHFDREDQMATPDVIDRRLLALEIAQGVTDRTKDLENRVRDLESMVRTAPYVLTVGAALGAAVGIGVTAYASWLSGKLQNAKSDAEALQARLAAEQTTATSLENKYQSILQNAPRALTNASPSEVQASVQALVAPIAADLQQLKQNLGTWRANAREEDKPKFFISSAAADQNGSFNCNQGYYMIGLTFKNNNLPQVLCRPLAELAPQ